MNQGFSPERWAFEITHVLNTVLGADHFPIDVTAVAREYTAQKFPSDPIVRVQGEDLPGFEGALFKAPAGKKGWGIFYNNRLSSKGRINFTLAHELGHYLLHRVAFPEGIRCGEDDMVQWDSEFGQIEHQANVFSANLLMPLDDYRRQINPAENVTLDMLAHCADRYRVSLAAATLRWLDYTHKRAVLVVSRDGFILWARSSKPALKTGAFFRTSIGPIAIPPASLAAAPAIAAGTIMKEHPANVWFAEPTVEVAMVADKYDYVFSLLSLADSPPFNFDEWRTRRR
ncbi:ImmA/IrrE family metallo-endopeptidase [Bradyrhizobium sp. 62B]|uniref:ImmA/IrrE family metallo-endopeptidase n=1 Tax=Bradyrhizobium sp. 62B TaxID=2898442 RepID=UPI002557E659|nr:ImmA/IrrE family metallo-endopeptidase [Bradyrhizobium sp. 62B]